MKGDLAEGSLVGPEAAGVGLGRPQGGLGDLGAPRWGAFGAFF